MRNKKLTPITRINKFFSEEDFNLEIEMGRESVEGDGNFTIILYNLAITSLIRAKYIWHFNKRLSNSCSSSLILPNFFKSAGS